MSRRLFNREKVKRPFAIQIKKKSDVATRWRRILPTFHYTHHANNETMNLMNNRAFVTSFRQMDDERQSTPDHSNLYPFPEQYLSKKLSKINTTTIYIINTLISNFIQKKYSCYINLKKLLMNILYNFQGKKLLFTQHEMHIMLFQLHNNTRNN